uniref:Uncharacterized protein n=1 Tax=Caenorhabditis japonica TaxID=281687 RepID=A0A8R1DQX4_CAEJA
MAEKGAKGQTVSPAVAAKVLGDLKAKLTHLKKCLEVIRAELKNREQLHKAATADLEKLSTMATQAQQNAKAKKKQYKEKMKEMKNKENEENKERIGDERVEKEEKPASSGNDEN